MHTAALPRYKFIRCCLSQLPNPAQRHACLCDGPFGICENERFWYCVKVQIAIKALQYVLKSAGEYS